MKNKAAAFTVKFVIFTLVFLLCAALLLAAARRTGERGSASASAGARYTVLIDPGHGGADGGAVGVSGALEKDINLGVSLALRDLLILCGRETAMTREDDNMLSLDGIEGSVKGRDIKSRVRLADETEGGLLVSIHTNSYPIEKYHGMQVFYSKNTPDGALVAEAVRQSCAESLQPENKRQTKPATSAIYLLHHVRVPAIMVECGFISNTAEEALLRDPAYRVCVAATICAGILNFN